MNFSYVPHIKELRIEEEEISRGTVGKRKKNNNDDGNNGNDDSRFKSKNLTAERKRRAKLSDRLLQLRALVPIITNMTKEYIIKDAITYITMLDAEVRMLRDELLELGSSTPTIKEKSKPIVNDQNNEVEEVKTCRIEPEVKVISLDHNKLWIKVVFEKKMGGFTKLVEAITCLGLELNDTIFTTSKETAVVSSCLQGMTEGCLDIEETKEAISSVISNILS